MAGQHGDEPTQGKTVKRRGILAAAGAVMAGIVAKQTSQPVGATVTDTNFVANGTADYGLNAGTAGTFTYGVYGRGSTFGIQGYSTDGNGVYGYSSSSIGVQGHSFSSLAVYGESDNSTGVYGRTNAANSSGVNGFSDNSIGVRGDSITNNGVHGTCGRSSGAGVQGLGGGDQSNNTTGFPIGVRGSVTNTGFGVYGNAGNGSAVYGVCTGGYGVGGIAATGFGVVGQTSGSSTVAGVYGSSTTTYGIIGKTTAAGYSGLTAITNTPNVAALGATSTVPNAFAAFFTGTTVVNGDFAVTGNKSAAVAHPDGTHRLLYCVESPEAWFEDFGKAKLVGGKADIPLDADFAALIGQDEYHVFLTTYGESNGLFVSRQSAAGFTVQERTKGTSSLTISWRVVAKRKDNPGKRLEKFVMPKINHPDPDKLPKPEQPKKP